MLLDKPLSDRASAWAYAVSLILALSVWALVAFPAIYVFGFLAFPTDLAGAALSPLSFLSTYFERCFPFGLSAFAVLAGSYGVSLLALAIGVASFALPIIAVKRMHKRLTHAPSILDKLPKAADTTEHGSARLIEDPKEIAKAWKCVEATDMDMDQSGIVLGYWLDRSPWHVLWEDLARRSARIPMPPEPKGRYFVTDGDIHVAIFGSTRAGKSRRILIPTIEVLMRGERESALVLDPKGELYGLCSEELRRRGVKVNRIDLRYTEHSDCRNPMGEVVELWNMIRKEKDSSRSLELTAKVSQRVQDLVEMLFPTTPDEGQAKYFNDGARAQIRSAIHYVASSPFCPDEQKTLATVSRVLAMYADAQPLPQNDKRTFVPYEAMLEKLPADHPAVEAWAAGRGGTAKETAQFSSTAQGPLQLYRDPSVMRITQTTTTPLENLGKERSITFLIVPQDRPAYAGFANLYIQQTYSALSDLATDYGGRLPQNVTIIGEEIGNLTPIPDLAGKLGFGTGLGIRWVLVLQNLAKMQDRYGERPATDMVGNCGVQCFIKTDEIERTGKHIETMLGTYTTTSEGQSRSGARLSPFKPQGSDSVRTVKRQLLTADELAAWTPDMGNIVIKDGIKYLMPLPDLSKMPTERICGLGDKEHNQEMQQRALCGGKPNAIPLPKPWYPELKRKRDYTANMLKVCHASYMRELGYIYLARYAVKSQEPSQPAKGNGAPLEHQSPKVGSQPRQRPEPRKPTNARGSAKTPQCKDACTNVGGIGPDDAEWAGW